jgi:osmotically-inducible protein OsmY
MVQPQAVRSDDEIQRDVVDALMFDVRVDGSNLNVEVRNGVVYLRGAVPSLFEKSTAQQIVERIKGVGQVINDLDVTPVSERGDAVLKEEVESALRRGAFIDEEGIMVDVRNGVVVLRGTVSSYTERASAEDTARLATGAKNVVNQLIVTPGPRP